MNRQDEISVILISPDTSIQSTTHQMSEFVLPCKLAIVEKFEDTQLETILPHDIVLIESSQTPEATLEAIQRIAASLNPPLVVVLNRKGSDLAVPCLVAGAVDVVDWPVSTNELALRILLRLGRDIKIAHLQESEEICEIEAIVASKANLTAKEAKILHVLFRHAGKIVSRDALSLAVDSRRWSYGDRKFDVHVAKIRKKLNEVFDDAFDLSAIRASGYQLKIIRDISVSAKTSAHSAP